ncbi:MAG: hypothetical protein IPP97_27760 [Candidatus Obscuribacter sp.]|nr:hypothetical protein [Candidatus Obscuribacter sp.]
MQRLRAGYFCSDKNGLGQIKLPDLKGKHVVLKPNMVEYRADKPVTTNPALLALLLS